MVTGVDRPPQILHPLDPLTSAEIARAAEIVRKRGGLSSEAWFETIALHEPEKAELAQKAVPPRRAFRLLLRPRKRPDMGRSREFGDGHA